MLNIPQFNALVVRPTLEYLGMWSRDAAVLVIGTGIVESRLHYLKQIGHGPALGIYQVEPATHDDIWSHYLRYRPDLSSQVRGLLAPWPDAKQQLVTNLSYATAMCRLVYRRRPEPLPKDPEGMAMYHKVHYNTILGKSDPKETVRAFRQADAEVVMA